MIDYRQFSHHDPAYRDAIALRKRILRTPLGLVFTKEEIQAEAADYHLGAFANRGKILIGCLVLSPLGEGSLKMRQVAVDEAFRGQGVGKALVAVAETIGQEHGFTEMTLNAREPVVSFYEALGYQAVGPPFLEVTLPHRRLRKALEPA